MCQMSVYTDKNGQEELILEDVTSLEVVDDGIVLTSLFEGAKTVNATIQRIDFSNGKVLVTQNR